MPEEKTKGNKILEEALEEACKNDCEHYPPYEGEIETGERYARFEVKLLHRYGPNPKNRVTTASKRVSVLAASLILVCACSMAAFWMRVIFRETPPYDTQSTGMTTQSTTQIDGTLASVATTPDARPSHSTAGTSSSWTEVETTASTTDSTPATPEIPDEKNAVYQVVESNADGLHMVVTVHGYQSESLERDFYVKNNEYFLVEVKITNTGTEALYQWLPTFCRGSFPAHNHEIGCELAHGDRKLSTSSFGFACTEMVEIWRLEPGETYEWTLKLAAGEVKSGGDYDLPGDGDGYSAGIDLYGNDIYKDGVCTFAGEFSFDYKTSDQDHFNDRSLSVPLSVDVVYISSEFGR